MPKSAAIMILSWASILEYLIYTFDCTMATKRIVICRNCSHTLRRVIRSQWLIVSYVEVMVEWGQHMSQNPVCVLAHIFRRQMLDSNCPIRYMKCQCLNCATLRSAQGPAWNAPLDQMVVRPLSRSTIAEAQEERKSALQAPSSNCIIVKFEMLWTYQAKSNVDSL